VLETRKVFIDTECFVKAGLHFDNPTFKSFRKHCENNELIHIITSVVGKEVESKIHLSVTDALTSLKNFKRKARILSELEDDHIKSLFSEISEADIHKKSLDVFREFIEGCKTELVDASSVNPENILSLYFDKKPPFGDGKKKAEFPDALSLFSLKSTLEPEDKIYVISGDSDLKSFCNADPQLISLESLDKLLDLYSQHTNKLTDEVKLYLESNEDIVKGKIEEYLEGCDVYNVSSWEDAEVDNDALTVINLGNIVPSVIFINDEESQITFDIDVEFEVTVTGPDFNNGIYDREDGLVYTFDNTSQTKIISRTYTVETLLYYDSVDGNIESVEYEDLYIAGVSSGIEVDVEENESEDHYK